MACEIAQTPPIIGEAHSPCMNDARLEKTRGVKSLSALPHVSLSGSLCFHISGLYPDTQRYGVRLYQCRVCGNDHVFQCRFQQPTFIIHKACRQRVEVLLPVHKTYGCSSITNSSPFKVQESQRFTFAAE